MFFSFFFNILTKISLAYSFTTAALEMITPLILFFLSGFGFSDKPQPRYGFDYTLDGNCLCPKQSQIGTGC